jgi:hypothetical protein
MFTSPPAGAGAAFRWRLTSRPLSPAAHARTFCVTESAWRGRSAAEADAAPQQHRHAQYAWPPSPTWRHFLRRSFDPRGKTPKIGSVAALPWALSEPLLRPTQESSVALPRSVGDGSSSAGPRNPTRSQCPGTGLRKSQTLFSCRKLWLSRRQKSVKIKWSSGADDLSDLRRRRRGSLDSSATWRGYTAARRRRPNAASGNAHGR